MKAALLALILCAPAAAAPLSLEDYLRQVSEGHGGARAALTGEAAARGRSREAEVPLSLSLFVDAQRSLDAAPKNFPAAEGERAERGAVSAGLQKTTRFGATGRVYYSFMRTDLIGANPLFVQPPSFYQASPVAEVSVDLWRNLWGRETRGALASARNRALARASYERLSLKGLLARAEGAYWTLAAARRKEALARESLARAERLRDWVSERVRRSLADRSEGLEAEAVVRLRALEAKAASDGRRAAERAFSSLRGGAEAAEELEPVEGAAAESRPASKPLAVVAAEHERAAAEGEAAAGVERTRPKVEAFAAGSLNGRDGRSAPAVSDSFGPDGPRYTLGARLAVPLDLPLLRGVRVADRLEADAARLRLARAEFDAAQDWRDLSSELADARERAELARAIETAQKDRAEAERGRQKEGRTTTYFVLQAEEDWAAAQRGRVDAELAVRLASARMRPLAED